MPQPVIVAIPGLICQYGNAALPNGQGTMPNLNLNDFKAWFVKKVPSVEHARQIGMAQYAWLAESTELSDDFPAKVMTVQAYYYEGTDMGGAGLPWAAQRAALTQSGTQFLTFDNLTQTPARPRIKKAEPIKLLRPVWWDVEIEFLCRSWTADIAATNPAAVPIVNAPTAAPSGAVAAGGALATGTYTLQYTYVTSSGETAPSPASAGIALTTGNQQISVSAVTLPAFATAVKWYFATGPTTGFTVQNNGAAFTLNTAGNGVVAPAVTPATAFAISYTGAVFTRPVWTLSIQNTNAAPIRSFVLSNQMSGASLTVLFPGNLTASTAWTITIDSSKFTVTDQAGNRYDFSGTFPFLHPSAQPGVAQSQNFLATLTAASGTPSGASVAVTYFNRWDF